MKILICEDDERKFIGIQDVILASNPTAEIKWVKYSKAALNELISESEYDILIQDMQLPINSDSRIDPEGGLYVLNQLKYRRDRNRFRSDLKVCVCSSDKKYQQVLIDKGFDEIDFIYFASFSFVAEMDNFISK
jgi:CheY-like chemotaxis protein